MSNAELQQQFERCQIWKDSKQWFLLACAYLERGYTMNAVYCFRQSELCTVSTETVVGHA